MKIQSLHLTAFGPFTGATLDFSSGNPGFHLVYGPNEAGKSSALRALRALLYGIDQRTPDNFIHPYNRMRIGGKLVSENGRILEIVRRKGRTSTLRASDDQAVVDEAVLSEFLNNVDASMFSTMFGIGYDDLVAGGKEIISGGGDLGQLVFSAGSGIVRLKEIRDALGSEAENLFKPSGKVPSINAAISRLKENEKLLRETMLSGGQWTQVDKELKKTAAERESVETRLKKHEKTRHYLSRVKEALPLLARRREVIDLLEQFQNAPLLPEDFSETRKDLVVKLDMAGREAARAQQSIDEIQKEMAGIFPSDAVIDNADLIEAFHQQLGSQHKAAEDRVKLDTRRATLLGECHEILRGLSDNLTMEDARRLGIKKDQAAAIRHLASEYEQITARIDNARDMLPGLEEQILQLEEKKRNMAAPRPLDAMDAIQTALVGAMEYGPLEKRNKQDIRDLEVRKSTLDDRLKKTGIAGKTAGDLEKLPVPEMETIQLFEEQFDQASRQISENAGEQKKISQRIVDVQASIKAKQMAQAVPSEADLNEKRKIRDKGWNLIRQQLEGKNPELLVERYLVEAGNAKNLQEAFEDCIKTTDDLADRLRREADRVAEQARLAADYQAALELKKILETEYEQFLADKEELETRWANLWSGTGIEVKTPREMDRWKRDMIAVKQELNEFEISCGRTMEIKQAIDAGMAALAEALKPLFPGCDLGKDSLNVLILRAQKLIEKEKSLASDYEKIDSELSSRRKELSGARSRMQAGEKALERWRTQWQKAVSPLGLSADARPAEADAVMEELRTLFEKLREAEVLEKRIIGIDKDARGFSEKVCRLAMTVAPDLAGRPPEETALELHARLTRSREAQTRFNTLEKHLSAEKQNLEAAGKTTTEIKTWLARMCDEARCKDYLELATAEERSRARRDLETERKSLEERLLVLSAGATVDEFAATAAAVDADTIDPEIARCKQAISALEEEKNKLAETIGSLRNELSKMDGSAKAARLAEERQEILGRLDPEARHYSGIRIAARILDMAIERFRDKNQDPMLNRASELFAEITCGAFSGIRPEFDEAGRPVITGVREGDCELVNVEAMSDGTADQLYLALRLAGLEMTIEKSRPMPFIVDDILIKFDNERAAAALETMAELSATTQVIFFTHHHHLIELAENRLPKEKVIFHLLSRHSRF